MLSERQIVMDTADALVRASSSYSPDQLAAQRRAAEQESGAQSRWVLEKLAENAVLAQELALPLCDDTGIPHVLVQIGDEAALPPGFLRAVEEGIALGLRRLPARPMAVLGDDKERLEQSAGLSADPGMVVAAPMQVRRIPGKDIILTVLMLGGGPEIRGKTQRVFHKHSLAAVKQEMIDWALEGARLLGCLPCVLFFGIGRSNAEAASLTLEAMLNADFRVQSPLEAEITTAVNASGLGPLALGGNCTALATFIKVGPQRASGVRIISLRVGCCMDPRKASVIWRG